MRKINGYYATISQSVELLGAYRHTAGAVHAHSELIVKRAVDDEPRRLHLGLDIWGPAQAKVMAPLPGKVHSFANNASPGDYGATIILEHPWEGKSIFALYGHLSIDSISELWEGKVIAW